MLDFLLRFWAAGLCFLGLCLLEFLCAFDAVAYSGGGILIWFLLKVLQGALVVYVYPGYEGAPGRRGSTGRRQPGLQGAHDRLYGEFRRHGENLNNLRQASSTP